MANPDIARCACPICSGDAALRETSKKKAYIVCENCGVQIFARGPESNRLLRAKGGAGEAATPAPAIQEAQKPAQQTSAPVTVRTHSSDGETEEKTIFDILGSWGK